MWSAAAGKGAVGRQGRGAFVGTTGHEIVSSGGVLSSGTIQGTLVVSRGGQ